MWFVYVLLCSDGSLYTGATPDVEARFRTHQSGKGGKYTRSHPPIKVVYTEACDTRSAAQRREYQIKGWSRKEKIELLHISKQLQSL